MWHGGAGAGADLFLADVAPVHAAGGVVPTPDGHSLHYACFHDVAAVLVDVVVGLADLPKATVRREKQLVSIPGGCAVVRCSRGFDRLHNQQAFLHTQQRKQIM